MTYNIIFTENKVQTSYLNLTEKEFIDILWMWTYEYDLWDIVESNEIPTEEDFRDWAWGYFVPETMLHEYEDDDLDCSVFCVNDKGEVIICYSIYADKLVDFIIDKVKQKGYKFKEND